MSEAHFSLIFRGPAVENGEIDVQDLAPAMLAAGDLLQSANDVINGENARVAVKVRATAHGSFEVDLSLWTKLIDSLFTYAAANKDGIAAANELADLVLKTGTAGGGLLALLKFLRGRRPEKIEPKGGDVIIHIGDNHFTTNQKTVKLAEDLAVRGHARKLVSALEREGIESIAARQEGREELEIERKDVASFEVPDVEEEELVNEVRRMNLQIIALSFKEENKWRLTDGAEPFTANIEDADFLKQIANDQVSFAKNDYLTCDVRERQIRTQKGLRKERTIIKVIEHRPAVRQLRLM